MRTKWNKIIMARVVEGLLTAAAFGVGLWHTLQSKKLEEQLDSNFTNDTKLDEETEDDT